MSRVSWARTALVAIALAAPASCVSTGPGDEPWGGRSDTTLALRVGQEVGVRGSVMGVSFLGVRSDSRCPLDAMCVWAGDAPVEIGVRFGMGPTVPYVLHTGGVPRSVDVGMYRITLVGLWPVPLSYIPIRQESYVAELRVELVGR